MIDIVTYTKTPPKPRRPKIKVPLVLVVAALRTLAASLTEPREIEEFASLLQLMGPEAATEYLISQPPTCAWIERMLSKLPEEKRVVGSGIGIAVPALRGKVLLT